MLSEKKHCNNKHKSMQSSILTRGNQPMLKRHRGYKVVNSLSETWSTAETYHISASPHSKRRVGTMAESFRINANGFIV